MFKQTLPVLDGLDTRMVRPRGLVDAAGPVGIVDYELSRGGRILVPRTRSFNAVNNTAKNLFLNAMFNGGTRYSSYYIGLVNAAGFGTFSATDTISAHLGWAEFTGYTFSGSGTSRGTWTYGSATSQLLTNSSPVIFDFTGTGSVYGIMIVADPTKSGTGSPLWSTAAFAAPLAVQSGDQLRVTYTVQL